jgi:hypothetical protein
VTLPSEDRERLLARLRRVDPVAFRSEVRGVLVAYGSIASAAIALRVAQATLQRWVDHDASLLAGVTLD